MSTEATAETDALEDSRLPGSASSRDVGRPRLARRFDRLRAPANRRLLVELIRAGLRSQDHNAFLGVAWSLLGPLTMLLVLYLIFEDRFGAQIDSYGLYLLIGILILGFFLGVTKLVMPIFITHKLAFLNTRMPRETFFAAIAYPQLQKLVIELLFCLALALFYGVATGAALWLLLPPLVVSYGALALGTGLLLALAYSSLRDVEHLWTVASRLFLFVTPVFYALDSLHPPLARVLYWANPLSPFLISFRGLLIGDPLFDSRVYLHANLLGLVTLAVAYALFLVFESRAVERA